MASDLDDLTARKEPAEARIAAFADSGSVISRKRNPLGVDIDGTFADLLLIGQSTGHAYFGKVPSRPWD